jgi:hypothetical protein
VMWSYALCVAYDILVDEQFLDIDSSIDVLLPRSGCNFLDIFPMV